MSTQGTFGPCCTGGDCCGPGSYCCSHTGPHTHPEEHTMSNKVEATYHPSKPSKPHTVIINHPSGRTTTQQGKTLRDAQIFLGMALLDNGYAKTKREAQTLANVQPYVAVQAGGALAVIQPGGTPDA